MSASRGNIYKRNDQWGYRFSYRDNAKRRRWKSAQGFESRKLAATSLTAALALVDGGYGLSAQKIALNSYLKSWCDTYEQSGRVKESTARMVHTHIYGYIVPMLGGNSDKPLLLGKLTREMVERFIADLLASGSRGRKYKHGQALSAKTVKNIVFTLRQALRDAVKRGYLTSNPASDIDLPRWDRADLKVWDGREFAQFLQVAADHGDPFYPLWRLVVSTGIRRGELLGLRWCDVDLVEGTITIAQTRQSKSYKQQITTPKTKAGKRTIAIDSGTVTALAHLKNTLSDAADLLEMPLAELVASDLSGRQITGEMLMTRFKQATDRANLPRCRIHDLRHAAAADALSRGIPVHIVAGRLGHANPSITLNIYAAFLPRADRDVANAGGKYLDDLMSDSKARTKSAPNTQKRTEIGADATTRRIRTSHKTHRIKPSTTRHHLTIKDGSVSTPISGTLDDQSL